MRAGLLVVCAMLAACSEDHEPPSADPTARPLRSGGEVHRPTETDDDEELEPPPPSSWPARIESLRESIDAFESVEACRSGLRASTPTSVAEGLADLSYDGFLDDVCRALDAVKRGSVEDCDALAVSAARAGCRTRLALVHAQPSACPDARVMDGLDPLCVAWSARDPDLCRAVAPPDEVRCRAVLSADERACRALRGGDRERCAAAVRRYASALGEERSESPAAREPIVMRLEVEGDGGVETIERSALARGVRAAARGCRYRIALASPHGEPALAGPRGASEPTFQLELTFAPGAPPVELPLGALEAVLSVVTRERGSLSSIAGASGTVTIDRFEPRIGGALSGRIEGTLSRAGVELDVRGTFATFLRDVQPLPDACAATPD